MEPHGFKEIKTMITLHQSYLENKRQMYESTEHMNIIDLIKNYNPAENKQYNPTLRKELKMEGFGTFSFFEPNEE